MKKKIGKIFDVLMYIFIGFAAIFTIISVSSKKDPNDAFTIGGRQLMVVETESMEKNDLVDVSDYEIKNIKKDSIICVETVPEENPYEFYDDIEMYDVLTFKYMVANRQEIITHRVIDIEEIDGGFIFTLRGDNINEDGTTSSQIINTTEEESFNYIIGKVKWTNYPIGLIVTALKSKVGLICMIIIPCVILIGFEIMKIVNEFNKDKKQKAKDKDEEIEELRRRIQQLEGGESNE